MTLFHRVLISALAFSQASTALAIDVHSENSAEPFFVRVSSSRAEGEKPVQVRFEFCEATDGTVSCSPLGRRAYRVTELQDLRRTLRLQAAGTVVLDVALAFAGWNVGALIGLGATVAAIVSVAPQASATAVFAPAVGVAIGAGVVGAGAATVVTPRYVDVFNPFSRLREASSVREDVILDRPILVESVEDFALTLSDALDSID